MPEKKELSVAVGHGSSRGMGQPNNYFQHPFTFSRGKKLHIVAAGILFIFNAAFGSSLPSGAKDEIAAYFNIPVDSTLLVLPTSLYLVGFALGPLIFGPLSEHVGRKPVLVGTFSGYIVFTLGCALSPNFASLLIFRLLTGLNAASPNAVLGGLYADILESPQTRGTAMALFMVVTAFGPQMAPLVSGFISTVSWRWTFWVGLILGAVCFPLMVFIPETYVPVLKKRALQKQVKEESDSDDDAANILNSMPKGDGILTVFTRPFVMTVQEPILLFSSLFMGFTYAVFYLYFQAYPLVFQDLYGLSAGIAGLAFLPISVGAVIAFIIFMCYGMFHTKANKAGKKWTTVEEYRRLPLAAIDSLLPCSGSPGRQRHPSTQSPPLCLDFFFGLGYILIFMAMINYLTDAYKQYSASAQAAASTIRSTMAVCLPLATNPMYSKLGINWATSLLAFISLSLAIIPFAFMRYGEWIRGRSPFAQRVMKGEVTEDRATGDEMA
ncbi:hypothetical protein N7509_011787 [Penicillium cosmopolitanum]|uniref:Major facilitator superfamily (MFS) profile domain-containing protein n=1 Tax=Penicillium cosmopolitanum TaxID=1131564 RepID=A0A9W9VE05_9EURO|nr:uncharacterized protein N7509_011787 [Penicillium cosmopolitanum]KAJ5378668.1 hypothetical protein N7509_011787 [Penicillium cosmopolitanum]